MTCGASAAVPSRRTTTRTTEVPWSRAS
jgi:hypothetical protein